MDDVGRELAYYKKRLDELAGESLKLDYQISGLRKELLQKRQAFTLLSRLQQTIGAERDASQIFALVLREVNSTLGMDKTVILGPTDREDHFRPSQWTGFTEQGRSEEFERRMAETVIAFPHEFSEGTGRLLINRKTDITPFIQRLRDTFELPFFVCVPVLVEQKPMGLLLSGRIKEAGSVFPPLDHGDVETFQAIAGLVSASIENMRIGVLRETDRLKTEFFANISHEFRTPITLTLGPLQQLLAGRYGDLPAETRERLRVIQHSQERLLGLVNQILDLAKFEAGGVRLRASHTPRVNEMIARQATQFRQAASERGLELRLRLGVDLDSADLFVDREKFNRLLFNLLSNALKFTRHGSIAVATWVRDGMFWLEVADTGIGIKEDQLPYIFDRFRQADGSESREYAGTGIGLALVREIVRAHSGEISVFSQYGKGTTFKISLPLGRQHLTDDSIVEARGDFLDEPFNVLAADNRSEPGETEKCNKEAETVFDAARATVLCAEDNPDLRAHIRDLLRSDYNIFVAADGHEALRMAHRYRPDLIITDQMMPNVSGRELLRRIRDDAALRSTPVVFLTARAGTQARIDSLEGGADDYLTKPFHEGELKARVANLIHGRAQEKALAALNRRLEARVEEQLAELVRTGELKRFLPQQIVEGVLTGQLGTSDRFERQKVSVLFVELEGFATTSAVVEPEDLAVIASDFSREMVAIAVGHGGMVANATAQSLMVLFEARTKSEPRDHAMDAVKSAIKMREGLAQLVATWRKRGIAEAFSIRAAINTGFCTVGVFGSEYLRCYTAVGAPVQIAAGLRSAASGGQILCARPTFALVEGRIRATPCWPLTVDGVLQPVEAFEIQGLAHADISEPFELSVRNARRAPLLCGSVLAHYQIVKKIGKGGMGEVYRAWDRRLDRPVALKLLASQASDDEASRQRLLREARAVAALKHPHIVNVYSVEEDNGRHFITMELLEGDSLSDLIPPAGLEKRQLLELALPLVDALAAAHAEGVTHRDLKPENILIDRKAGLKVLDFGLARIDRLADTNAITDISISTVTAPDEIVGTVPYMSPEQIQGGSVDHRSDIFSTGVILYEMATGHRPFRGVTSADVIASILRDEPDSIAKLRPDLPTPFERIISRCVAKNSADRYSSAKTLFRELEILC